MIRKFCLTLAAVITTASISMVSAQQTAKVTASGIGYLEYLPQGYNSNSNKYPVVISLHGIKEKGSATTDRNRIIADLQKVDNVGLPRYAKAGTKYPFILISPQLKGNHGTWPASYVMDVVKYVKKHYRIDDRRIYLTGLSLGGFGVWRTAGEYPDVFAAIAPVCSGGNALNKAQILAAKNVPTWGFHGSGDKIVSYTVTTKMVSAMNSAPKKPHPLAKATIFPGMGHTIWDKAYNQTNLLDWLLSHRKGSASSWDDDDDNNGGKDDDDDEDDNESSNKQPVVHAGADKNLTLPANSLYVQGNASDPDGKIASYRWTKVSGSTAGLTGTSSSRLRAYNLKEGTYVFRLTVKDDKGAIKSDEVKIIVRKNAGDKEEDDKTDDGKGSSKNLLPVVTAGPDRVITLPTNSITIHGRASDKDGKVVAYEWAKTYGTGASLSGANAQDVRISNLREGIYIFRLRAKDNDGGIKDDYFKITVNGAPENGGGNNDKNDSGNNSNEAPYASAGPDRVLNWPNNSISIQGHASDRDGRIISYHWAKTYGGRASLSGARTARVNISNLSPGVYIFRLSVKDNRGATKNDYFKITVRK